MAYIKTNWVNNETELNAQNMNHIEDGIEGAYGIPLLAVTDTAPAECEAGDKYYDETTGKIYTATGHNTWGTIGEDPEEGSFYIVFATQNVYTYDGQDLVSVGGGAGGQIAISEEEPTEEEILWINPEEETNQAKYKYNDEWQELNIKALDSMPIGAIIQFAGSTIPNGWLICDGTAISRETYADLYTKIGTAYGTGDGSTTFNVPNFKGKVAVGYNSSETEFNALGKTGGSKEMQKHSHRVQGGDGHFIHGGTGEGSAQLPLGGQFYQYTTNPWTNEAGTGNSGNLQPYLTVNYIIKALNTTPTMASVVNTQSDSTEDTYSCDFINKKLSYSTTEVKTNKTWINGKPVYQKVLEFSTTQTSEFTLSKLLDSDAEDVININGLFHDGTVNKSVINSLSLSGTNYQTYCWYRGTDKNICLKSTGSAGTFTAKVIVEYTKTTD